MQNKLWKNNLDVELRYCWNIERFRKLLKYVSKLEWRWMTFWSAVILEYRWGWFRRPLPLRRTVILRLQEASGDCRTPRCCRRSSGWSGCNPNAKKKYYFRIDPSFIRYTDHISIVSCLQWTQSGWPSVQFSGKRTRFSIERLWVRIVSHPKYF